MTMAEDPREIFESMMEGIELEEQDVEEVDFESMDTMTLIDGFHKEKRKLYDLGEVEVQTSEEGKDTYSRYYGYRIEMIKRGLQ